MVWHHWLPLVVFVVTFVASILSGMAGGGGGFIITPFLIAIGLTPQQSIATGKLGALGLDGGAIAAFRHRANRHRKLTVTLICLAFVIGIVSSFGIRHIGNDHLQLIMGIFNLAMVPLLFVKHHGLKSRRRHYLLQALGLGAIIVTMLVQGIFSSGIGSLINVFLILFFGVLALDANIMKRKSSLVSDVVVLVGLAGSGLINIQYGLISSAAGLAGGYIGSKFALREGEKFARYALMVFMVVSGVWLIATA
ncbi:MAG TPA: sulfite exporter TauE/SafE family protein [Candidatus Saccharimonadales bacterium]|nr:sulfite exporter TauE/SafE family protein [Candidatus Saccharimonadales bacterium]